LNQQHWRPTASVSALRQRARLLALARSFFGGRGVLEVETPSVVSGTVTDVQIASLTLANAPQRYLHTSPEFAMKRLLAAGSGDIFQICKVYRAEETSPLHNPEFTMIEWYRMGFGLDEIMSETVAVANLLLQSSRGPLSTELVSYGAAFENRLGIDPLTASLPELRQRSIDLGFAAASADDSTRDDLLDFLMATAVGPSLGDNRLTCVHHYPASQAALAQLDAIDPRTALRFELYCQGVELANGFVELADPTEQRHRFDADLRERSRRGLALPAVDEALLAALESGLPDCAGVALGFDRAVMLALGARDIDEVIAFPWERA
jgi:elongation factor P--(R)-beta-lysine ligase